MHSLYHGRRFVFDLETNGLLDAVTRVHCAVAIDIDTDEVLDFKPDEIDEFLKLYQEAELLIGHNIIGYDCAVIEKLYGIPIPPAERLLDTVNFAKLCFSDIKQSDFPKAKAWKAYKAKYDTWMAAERRKVAEAWGEDQVDTWEYNPPVSVVGERPFEFPGQFVGMHSLEAWGYRLGAERKGDYSKEMKAEGLDPWESWNPRMHAYMIQDGVVNLALYRYLLKQKASPQAILLEMRVQRLCSKIERNGWPFNREAAERLYTELCAERESLAQSLRSLFPPWTVQLDDFIPKRNNKTKGYVAGVPVERYETIEFNPSSRDHIISRLKDKYGWVPRDEDYTANGKPKVDDEVLQRLKYPEAKALARYFLIQKRIGQLGEGNQAWMRCVTKEGLIHGRYNTNGASTGRATHYSPNISQVPSIRAEYGRDCRALFCVPTGWKQLGADQAGLELRCLGSFLATFDGGAYIQIVLNGDVHWENAKALFGLDPSTERYGPIGDDGHPAPIPLHEEYRGIAKTFIYAFLYGAGPEKLGSVAGVKQAEAKAWLANKKHHKAILRLRNYLTKRFGTVPSNKKLFTTYKGELLSAQFLAALPALGELIKAVKAAAKKGWLKGLDGRVLPVRSEHSALNTLLQSAGAVICKQWITDAEDALVASGLKHGWDGDFVVLGWIHDELQVAVREGLEDRVSTILVETARRAGDPFKSWRCPTDGDAKVGANWADCH